MSQSKDGDPAAGVVGNAAMIEVNEVMVPLGDDNPLPITITGGATEAEQEIQTTHLAAIETAVESLETAVNTDGAAHGTTGLIVGGQDGGGNFLHMAVDIYGNQKAVGNVAHDAADISHPMKIGGRARTSEIAAVTNDDRTDSIFDKVGKQIVMPYALPENFVSGAITSAMTGTTSTSLIDAPAGSLRNYITTIVVSNAHGTVGTDVVIQDGNGGTTLMTIPAAAVYGGAVINLPVPLRQPTVGAAIYVANVTTGASTKVSAVGFTGL